MDFEEICFPGGGTSLSDHTGMCDSFGWFMVRKFLERDVLFKEKSGIGV